MLQVVSRAVRAEWCVWSCARCPAPYKCPPCFAPVASPTVQMSQLETAPQKQDLCRGHFCLREDFLVQHPGGQRGAVLLGDSGVEACSMVLGGKGVTLSHLLSEVPWAVACPAWRNLVACDRDCDTVGLTLSNGSSRDKSLLSIVIPI